ncbi:SGNH/GDSL hydrolase family protein [Flaviflexus huanghaiensis]|uniref:SGNH/GDSL hydrolase family protein n=1 Tax=Flaviflexus huanghaiensis TaxID=1111473 RepID=UPI0015FDD763|nr:SGNH/GDSL hydrolase family protein [Flaviflexus huanghaiensis]
MARRAHVALWGAGALFAGSQMLARRARKVSDQRRPYARFWERSNLAVIAKLERNRRAGLPDPLIYVALGDSAAQSLGATSVVDGYVPRLAAALEDMTGRDVALINLSVSGAVIPSVLTHQLMSLKGLERHDDIVPDIVTCEVGGNDVSYRLDSPTMAEFVESLTSALPRGTYIADVPSFGPTPHGRRAREISELMRIYADRDGHYLVPLENFTSGLSLSSYLFSYHSSDFFHPNTHAYQHWAQLWVDTIAPIMDLPTVDVADVAAFQPWA